MKATATRASAGAPDAGAAPSAGGRAGSATDAFDALLAAIGLGGQPSAGGPFSDGFFSGGFFSGGAFSGAFPGSSSVDGSDGGVDQTVAAVSSVSGAPAVVPGAGTGLAAAIGLVGASGRAGGAPSAGGADTPALGTTGVPGGPTQSFGPRPSPIPVDGPPSLPPSLHSGERGADHGGLGPAAPAGGPVSQLDRALSAVAPSEPAGGQQPSGHNGHPASPQTDPALNLAAGPSHTGTPVLAAQVQPASPATATTATSPAPTAPTRPEAPAEMVAAALRQIKLAPDGTSRVTLRLHPDDLGSVDIAVEVHGDAVALRVTADSAEARAAIAEHIDELKASLAEAGLNATSVDIGGPGSWAASDSSPRPQQSHSSASRAVEEPTLAPAPSTPSIPARGGLDVKL